jgi:probable rRNA maturation factor
MSHFVVDILNEHNFAIDETRLQTAVLAVLKRHELEPDSVTTVVIATDEEVLNLNKLHRGIDKPTDVLSFPAEELPDEIESSPYLGDIIIAYPYTQAQAEQEGFSMADSLVLMVIHGALHLLGYDHDTPENRAEMWNIQSEVLQEMGIDLAIVPAYEAEHE